MQRSLVTLLLAFVVALGFPSKVWGQQRESICDLVKSGCVTNTISTHTLEILPQARTFTNWARVSGGPSVIDHTADDVSLGLGVQVGINVGALGRVPIDFMFGTQFDVGLSTNFKAQTGDSVSGSVAMYGLGAGFRASPVNKRRVQAFMAAMMYMQLNRGEFDLTYGGVTRSETRRHETLAGDYTAGVMFFPTASVGFEVAVGYNGQFKQNNADENVRAMFGLVLSLGQRF